AVNAICFLVGFRVIGSDCEKPVACSRPLHLAEMPGSTNQLPRLARVEVCQPEVRAFFVPIDGLGVVLIVRLFLFGLRLGLGSEESNLLAVRRPLEPADRALSFRQANSFTSIAGHEENLLELALA